MAARAADPAAIRAPITVGKKWSSVVAITTETNPIRLSHACAPRPRSQTSRSGRQARHEQDGEARAERDVDQRSDVPTGHDATAGPEPAAERTRAWPPPSAPRPR